MVNYEECYKKCACFFRKKDKKQCMFKKMCILMELPVETEESIKELV